MSTTIKPTPGRIVLVHSSHWNGARPAIIVSVLAMTGVTLPDAGASNKGAPVFEAEVALNVDLDPKQDERGPVLSLRCHLHDPDKLPEIAGVTRTLQADEKTPEEWLYATWMPYQQGQAAKTEDVSVTLRARLDEFIDRTSGRLAKLERTVAELCRGLGATAAIAPSAPGPMDAKTPVGTAGEREPLPEPKPEGEPVAPPG